MAERSFRRGGNGTLHEGEAAEERGSPARLVSSPKKRSGASRDIAGAEPALTASRYTPTIGCHKAAFYPAEENRWMQRLPVRLDGGADLTATRRG